MAENSHWLPEVIVFGPGGMKVLLEVGCLKRLHNEKNFLNSLHTVFGCSTGSVAALLYTLNFLPDHIIEIIKNINILDDIRSLTISNFFTKKGLLDPSVIKNKLSNIIYSKLGEIPTLRRCYEISNLHLKMLSYLKNDNKEELIELSDTTYPELSCVDAVFNSINVPYLFQNTQMNKIFMDACLINPYPLDLIDDGKTNILGLYIHSKKQDLTNLNDINQLLINAYTMANTSIDQLKIHIERNCSDKCKHIKFYTSFTDVTGITFTNDIKKLLVDEGYNIGDRFIKELLYSEYHFEEPLEDTQIQYDDPLKILNNENITNVINSLPDDKKETLTSLITLAKNIIENKDTSYDSINKMMDDIKSKCG
jgi:predicted acylesterase/phospholipase RssA